jgi:hypothetical protein
MWTDFYTRAIHPSGESDWYALPPGMPRVKGRFSGTFFHAQHPPNYPQDLNAMHEAESTIPAWNTGHKPNSHSYSIVLTRILFAENKQRMTHNATARQRAEAFVLTLDSDSTKGV